MHSGGVAGEGSMTVADGVAMALPVTVVVCLNCFVATISRYSMFSCMIVIFFLTLNSFDSIKFYRMHGKAH